MFTVPYYFVRWSGSNGDLVMLIALKKPNGFFVFVIFLSLLTFCKICYFRMTFQ